MDCGNPKILDFRSEPLRLGGAGTADYGLFDFDINGEDVIVDFKNVNAWVDDYVVEAWGAPANSVPWIGRFFRWAVVARSTTTHSTAPHLWAVAQDDWHLHIDTGRRQFKQEIRAGLGLHPTPSVRAATALDSDEATLAEKQYVAGEPRPQRFHGGPLTIDFETVKTAALKATAASNNSTSFAANCNVTVLLWGVLGRKSEVSHTEIEAEAEADDLEPSIMLTQALPPAVAADLERRVRRR